MPSEPFTQDPAEPGVLRVLNSREETREQSPIALETSGR
jgi:hypothetical protein